MSIKSQATYRKQRAYRPRKRSMQATRNADRRAADIVAVVFAVVLVIIFIMYGVAP